MFWERLVGACDASVEGGPAITIPSARKSCQSIAPINIPASRNLRSSAGIIDGILPPRWHRSLQASQWLQLRQWLDLHEFACCHFDAQRLLLSRNLLKYFICGPPTDLLNRYRSRHSGLLLFLRR